MSEQSKWYVVHTYSSYENKVASSIEKAVENRKMENLIHRVYIPMQKTTEVKDDKTREIETKVFPGYVFIKMILTDESWYIVRNTRGCTGFVGPDSNKPLPLTDEEVLAMGVEKNDVTLEYKVGDFVTVCNGPLDGFSGVVEDISKELNKVHVLVSMFGRETPVELELHQVKIEK